jgi:hypothetical protein
MKKTFKIASTQKNVRAYCLVVLSCYQVIARIKV